MANKPLNQKPLATTMSLSDQLVAIIGNAVKRITLENVMGAINENQQQFLSEVAWYIEPNVASSSGSSYINVGGNTAMFDLWAQECRSGVMDKNGNVALLNKVDGRYFEDGTAAVNTSTNEPITSLAGCQWVGKYPKTYYYIQEVTISGTTQYRIHLSLVPLPGGKFFDEEWVGKYKASVSSNKLFSQPNRTVAASRTIKSFWDCAQAYDTNWGLAGIFFRNILMVYYLSKYGKRNAQTLTDAGGNLVFGVGLDGSENTSGSASDGFSRQYTIKTGACLSLGDVDGKASVLDAAGGTAHSINMLAWENIWGQFWEFDGQLCSIGSNVKAWKANFCPSGTAPADADFAHIDTIDFVRKTSAGAGKINIDPTNQEFAFFPKEAGSGIDYGDYYYYDASGQVWLWGGNSTYGSRCGPSYSLSSNVWSTSNSAFSARLRYCGQAHIVTPQELIALQA